MNQVLQDQNKLQAVLALYNQICTEITRCRDMEWKLTTWTIALFAGLIGLTLANPIPSAHVPYIKTLLIVFVLVSLGYSLWHILYRHKQLTWNRNMRVKCDELLGYYDDNVYSDTSLLPSEWKAKRVTYWRGLAHIVSWCALLILSAVFCVYRLICW